MTPNPTLFGGSVQRTKRSIYINEELGSKMLKKCFVGALLAVACMFSFAAVANGAGKGGGGGSTKPLTVRWVGNITAITSTADGLVVTLGTSYYAVGTGLVNADTKIKFNGSSSGTPADLRVGDLAQMDVLWPSRVAVKMEVVGTR
jgi:hypothetical protein